MSVAKEQIISFLKSVEFSAIEVYCFYFPAAVINSITTKKHEFSKIERIEKSRKGERRYHRFEIRQCTFPAEFSAELTEMCSHLKLMVNFL